MIDIEKLRTLYKFGKELSLQDAQELLKTAKSISFKKKEILFEQGSKDTQIYFLRKGMVRMYHIKDTGEEITFSLIPEHNVVANFDFIATEIPSKFYYETLENCSFFSIDYQVLDSIVSKNSKLESNRKFFLRKIIFEVKERLESFVLMTPEERYLKYIKDFPDLTNRVPDKYIANVLGITPVSLSRIRKRISSKTEC
ncbi:cAMP-binding domain of CRP or a regulatory subunit of cAMP-dependent protein kinases [Cyclobacterium xiamenense]|uniref:cAMP-binding domain of CRP or a regulatory subunit of cAMP-dependent protein kinases n=1 Tax=Cyclobacterium xiamenense TaxID=1297121 RepID=A0A1H7C4A4_9BACT|nr:Crp/Fnr family transcriptional regulator [Cyclobacterium xiamenense]SEJ83407.1 cAMP-binding domain of CRP or a regulatory subunit of cAMP-dependent protein kinases [Cyclobacterium xiamenense]